MRIKRGVAIGPRNPPGIGRFPGVSTAVERARARLERIRIRSHLRTVEQELRLKRVRNLSSEQRNARERNLDRLHHYLTAGRFPKNSFFPDRRVPIIRDSQGTLCAVAFLVGESGDFSLVDALAKRDNHVRIDDVSDGPLITWLRKSGLTKDEAARIQPNYDPVLDLRIFSTVLLAVLLPLRLLTSWRIGRHSARGKRARLANPNLIATVNVVIAIGLATLAVVALSPTYGDPFAVPFRFSLFIAFLLPLLAFEFVSLRLLRSLRPAMGKRRLAVELLVTLLNVILAWLVGSTVVWPLARTIFYG